MHKADLNNDLIYSKEESPHPDKLDDMAFISSLQETHLSPTLKFNFSDASLPQKWRTRIMQKFNSYSEVFAQLELDFGHVTKVKHHIKLKDETPFKQRSRPLYPKDYEEVRRHLKTL